MSFHIFVFLYLWMPLYYLPPLINCLDTYSLHWSQTFTSNLCTTIHGLHAAWCLILWYKNLFLCLGQWFSIKFSVTAEMFYICANAVITCHIWLLSPWNMATTTEELIFNWTKLTNLLNLNLHVHSHISLVAIALYSLGLDAYRIMSLFLK